MKIIKRYFDICDRALFRIDSTMDYDRTIEALTSLANAVDDCEDDVDWCLGECGECTLDSLMIGAYWFCTDYHGGQWSPEYALQCAIGSFFNPGMTSLEDETSEKYVYDALAAMHPSAMVSELSAPS